MIIDLVDTVMKHLALMGSLTTEELAKLTDAPVHEVRLVLYHLGELRWVFQVSGRATPTVALTRQGLEHAQSLLRRRPSLKRVRA